MKGISILCGLLVISEVATAQVGSWEVQIKRTGGVKEVGTGFITIKDDGTVTGYSLTTLTFGVATYAGTWSTGGRGSILVMFTETLGGQDVGGSVVGKFNDKSLKGTATFDNGVVYKFSGKPLGQLPDVSGNWAGTVKEGGQTAVESFTVTPNADFSGVFDFSGLIGGSLTATGQVVVASSGSVDGFSVTETGGGLLATVEGKGNLGKGILTTKGVDQNGVKLTGKFFKQ